MEQSVVYNRSLLLWDFPVQVICAGTVWNKMILHSLVMSYARERVYCVHQNYMRSD